MNSSITDKMRNLSVNKFNDIIECEKISRTIEKSIYNHTIKISKERNLQRSWNNSIFKGLYLSKIRSIYSNLNKDSYIHNTQFLIRVKNG